MKLRFALNTIVALALATMTGIAANAQTSYSFRSLGTLGGTISGAAAVNNSKQVVGNSYLPGGTISNYGQHAFYWENGVMVDMGSLSIYDSSARAINNLGEVVGFSRVSTNGSAPTHAFYWNNQARTMVDLNQILSPTDAALWTLTQANGINDSRKVVGSGYKLVGGQLLSRGFLLDLITGEITDMGTFGGTQSNAGALNQLVPPQVVGGADTGIAGYLYSSAGFLYNGAFPLTNLSPFDWVYGINNSGAMIGYLGSSEYGYRAPDGTITEFRLMITSILQEMNPKAINNATTATVIGTAHTYVVNGSTRVRQERASRWRVGETAVIDLNTITPNRGTIFLHAASGINDNGYIVGGGATEQKNGSNGNSTAYLLTPNP